MPYMAQTYFNTDTNCPINLRV